MTVQWELRADFDWPAINSNHVHRANPVKGMVAHYDGSNQGLKSKPHSACVAYWHRTRQFHMGPERGWSDIGYAWGVCPHGVVMQGRGWGWAQAAQPGGNYDWESCTFMSGPNETPTSVQLDAWFALREYLSMQHGMAAEVRGHLDFFNTDCPGDILYRMVKDGTLRHGSDDWMGAIMRTLPLLRVGSVSFDVKTARGQLYQRGFKTGLTPEQLVNWLSEMEFTPEFSDDVKHFQQAKKVNDDGVIGPVTWQLLIRTR